MPSCSARRELNGVPVARSPPMLQREISRLKDVLADFATTVPCSSYEPNPEKLSSRCRRSRNVATANVRDSKPRGAVIDANPSVVGTLAYKVRILGRQRGHWCLALTGVPGARSAS